ncbi:protein LOW PHOTOSYNTHETIC EFFICIENCY 1, chloroplastic-like [Carex rostrata]
MAPLLVASSTSTSTSTSYLHSNSHPNLRSFYHPFSFSFSFHKMKMIKLKMKSDGRTATTTATARSQSSNPKGNVRALSSALHNAKSADDVAQLLNHHNPAHLPLPVYTTLIKYLGIDQRLDAAFALLQWLKQNQTITLNHLIYNSLLNAVRLGKEFDRIDHVIHDMKSQGFEPNIVTYNTLMSIYIDQGRPQEVFNLFSEIQINGNLSPSPATYSTVLSAYKQMDDADGALEFFIKFREKYQSKGSELFCDWGDKDKEEEFVKMEDFTVQICQSLMCKWLVNKDLLSHTVATHKVLRFLTCMDKADVKLKQHFFEGLVWACTHEEHYPVIRELYKRLRESGPGADISVLVCNHIIWLMGKAKKWWAALEVYEEMLDKGPLPNYLSFELLAKNFTILMTSAGRRGLWRWALKLLKKMHQKGLTPGTREWNAVLIACAKAGETDAAVKIFQVMVQEGEKPTVHSYGALLNALGKGKLYDEAIRVWDHMLKVGVQPNLHAYTILASIYAQKGDHDTVELVLQEMTAAKIEPTVVTFNAIISSCLKGQMGATAAYEWFHKMKGRNVKPNEVSYETLIGALTNEGKPRLAYQMYVQAYNDGLVLNQKAYDAVVHAGQVAGVRLNLDDLGFIQMREV